MSDQPSRPVTPDITGVILAGGQGRRMGGVDKGLQTFRGRPMIESVIERLRPQVNDILVNANQNLEQYAAYGYRVVPDAITGFAGPLAGLHSALLTANSDLVLTVPCDSPLLSESLAERLHSAMKMEVGDVAVAKTGMQAHPVFCLVRRSLRDDLTAFLESGGRKIDQWYGELRVCEVDFGDQPDAFANFNTLQELHAGERRD